LSISAELKQAIERDFGSFENMQNQLSTMTVAVQGSGWGWLGFNRQTKKLQLATTFNQDLLEPTHGQFSVLLLAYSFLLQICACVKHFLDLTHSISKLFL
jgi:superoxide dismutase